jgi:hypothetical protein
MEVRDGFIVGVFNYCDGWCERCHLTSHCRLFADRAEMEASLDPHLNTIVDAPPRPEDIPPPPPAWRQELFEEADEACKAPPSPDEWERMRRRVPPEHEAIVERALEYSTRVFRWLRAHESEPTNSATEPRDVISGFGLLIGTKVKRALTAWPGEDPDAFAESDCDGSAKVALLGIDQSHAAWLALAERGDMPQEEANPFIADLVWLGEALEHVRPRARAFVRPGLDEPDAVAQLLAEAGGA